MTVRTRVMKADFMMSLRFFKVHIIAFTYLFLTLTQLEKEPQRVLHGTIARDQEQLIQAQI